MTITRRFFLRGAAGAVLALPFLESLLPRPMRAQAAQGPEAPDRDEVVQHAARARVVPGVHGNGYALKDSKYTDSKADGTTLLTQKSPGGPYTWAPLRDSSEPTPASGHPRPEAEPVPGQAHADPRSRFPAQRQPQLRRLARQLLVVHRRTPCTADELPDVPTMDQVLA